MDFMQPVHAKCIEKLQLAVGVLEEWSTTMKEIGTSIRYLEHHLDIFLSGENPIVYQTTVKWCGYSLYLFVKIFDDTPDVVASLDTFDPRKLSFEQYMTYASLWTSKASPSTKPFCEVIDKAMRTLARYGAHRVRPERTEFAELCQVIEALRFSQTNCATACAFLRSIDRSLESGVFAAPFDNPVYYTLMTHVLPALCKTMDQLFNRGNCVDGLSLISHEFQHILEYDCHLLDMHTSARYYLLDLDNCFMVIDSSVDKLSLTTSAKNGIRRLCGVVTSLISATDYYEQALKRGRVQLFSELKGPTYADFRTIREILLLLGRLKGSLESKIAEASETARKNPNLRGIAGDVIHLTDIKSSLEIGNDSRCAAYQFWMASMSWLRTLSNRLQIVQDMAALPETSQARTPSDGASSTSLVASGMQVEANADHTSKTSADCWVDSILC